MYKTLPRSLRDDIQCISSDTKHSRADERTRGESSCNPSPSLSKHEILRALRGNPWFQNLPEHIMHQIVILARPRRYAAGELVHRKFEHSARLFGIVSGGVRISSTSSRGREVVYSFMGAGSWFGHIGLLDGLSRTHDVRACQETVLVSITRDDFNRLLQDSPILYKHLALLLCQMVRSAFSALEDDALLSLEGRLAKRLLSLAETCGVPGEHGLLINLHLPQQDLGSLLSACRQTVNRKLVEWQARGWIKMHYGAIFICDRDALMQLCNEN